MMNFISSALAQVTACKLFAGLSFYVVMKSVLVNHKQATYGRYSDAKPSSESSSSAEKKKSWWDDLRADLPIPPRLGWFLLECPNLVLGGYTLARAYSLNAGSELGWLVVSLFMLHYVMRTLVFSFLLPGGSTLMPLRSVLQGAIFTMINGLAQTYHHLYELPESSDVDSLRVQVGVAVFFVGFYINQASDHKLRNLRKNKLDTAHYLPRGGLFEYLAAPNLVGEAIEWLGYALVANTFVAWCFAIGSVFFLGARAKDHFDWYAKKFADEWPSQRKALIPFVY